VTDVDDWDESPEDYEAAQRRAEEPPDSYFEEEADRQHQRHLDEEHGGLACDCPPYKPPRCRWWRWMPLWTPRKGWHCGTTGLCAVTGYRSLRAVWRVHRSAYHTAPF
jgi:hypothetical protein